MPYIKRTPCLLDLVPFGCTLLAQRILWQHLLSAGVSQTNTSDVYDSVQQVAISWYKPALKMAQTFFRNRVLEEFWLMFQTHDFFHPLLWTNTCLNPSLVWETKQHKRTSLDCPAWAKVRLMLRNDKLKADPHQVTCLIKSYSTA